MLKKIGKGFAVQVNFDWKGNWITSDLGTRTTIWLGLTTTNYKRGQVEGLKLTVYFIFMAIGFITINPRQYPNGQ